MYIQGSTIDNHYILLEHGY